MTTRTTDRDIHHLCGFGYAQVLIEDQVQRLALTLRQPGQCLPEPPLELRPLELKLRLRAGFFARAPERYQGTQHLPATVSYTHLRAHETPEHLVCRLLLE